MQRLESMSCMIKLILLGSQLGQDYLSDIRRLSLRAPGVNLNRPYPWYRQSGALGSKRNANTIDNVAARLNLPIFRKQKLAISWQREDSLKL